MANLGRLEILHKLRAKIQAGQTIIGGGAGTGLSAKCEEAGGVDLIVIYNSGRYRMAGRGSLAGYMSYGNANEIVVDMGKEVLPIVRNVPVLAGVNATDPFCKMEVFLPELAAMGFSGIQNFPTVGIIDGRFGQELAETGMSYELEVEAVALANRLDLFTTPYVFSAANAASMAKAGADIIVAHFGLTTGGTIGAQQSAPTIQDCAKLYNEWVAAARVHRDDLIFICHGGPLAEPEDAQKFLDLCPDCHGFYGASSMERLPTERAIVDQTRRFTKLRRGQNIFEGVNS